MYVGSRWAKFCHPDEFMQSNGYTTSSTTINSIIEQEGLDSFEIIRIDTNLDGLSAYDYETIFLQCIDCAKSKDWYNSHNNDGKCPAYGTEQFRQLLLEKYDNEFYNNPTKNKITCLEKYNVDHQNKRESEKLRLSNAAIELNKRQDMIDILLERNTNNNPSKTPENRIRLSDKLKETNQKMLEQGTHPAQKQHNRDAASAKMKITMANLPILICPHCKLEGKGSNMKRWHFDNCKLKP